MFGGAPAVLPFLLDLAEEPSVTVRVAAIDLVARIASEADRVSRGSSMTTGRPHNACVAARTILPDE